MMLQTAHMLSAQRSISVSAQKNAASNLERSQAWASTVQLWLLPAMFPPAYAAFIRAASLGFGDEPFFLSLFKTSLTLGLQDSAGIWLRKRFSALVILTHASAFSV